MTLPALYCDQDSSDAALVEQLRLEGVDVVVARDVGNARLDDPQQLEYATSAGRAIYTANQADFARLQAVWARDGRSHGGIVIRADQNRDVGYQLRALLTLLQDHEESGLRDLILYI